MYRSMITLKLDEISLNNGKIAGDIPVLPTSTEVIFTSQFYFLCSASSEAAGWRAFFITSTVCSHSFFRWSSSPKYRDFPRSSPLELVLHAPGLLAVWYMAFHMYSPHSVADTEKGRVSGMNMAPKVRINQDGEEEVRRVRTNPG